MRPRAVIVAGVIAALGAAWANTMAWAATGSDGTGALPEVTVRAKRAELLPRLSTFAYGITEPVNGEGLARWNAPVCPLVAGLAQPQGEFVLERLSEIARAAGVPLAPEQCKPNLYIMVTAQPRLLLQAMESHRREVVFANASPVTIDAFIEGPDPIKVWYSTYRTLPGGKVPTQGVPPAAQVLGGGLSGAPTYSGSWLNNSHLQAPSEFNLAYVYIVADQARVAALSRGQFADYVAMVGLAELKSPPHLGDAQTILKLFAGAPDAALPALSTWDEAFLKALYRTDPSTRVQRNQLGLEMTREIAP